MSDLPDDLAKPRDPHRVWRWALIVGTAALGVGDAVLAALAIWTVGP